MVWYNEGLVTSRMMSDAFILSLQNAMFEDDNESSESGSPNRVTDDKEATKMAQTLRACAEILTPYLADNGLVTKALEYAQGCWHVMDFTLSRAMATFFSLMRSSIQNILTYNVNHPDFPLSFDQMEAYLSKKLIMTTIWSFAGDSKLDFRGKLGKFVFALDKVPFRNLFENSMAILRRISSWLHNHHLAREWPSY
jgi:dynein heavy chain 1